MKTPHETHPMPSSAHKFGQPANGSINAIIHQNCSQRLFVPPIAWTTAHLDFLNIGFDRLDEQPQTKAKQSESLQVGIATAEQSQSDNERLWLYMQNLDGICAQSRKHIIREFLEPFGIEIAEQPRTESTPQVQDPEEEQGKIFAIQDNGFFFRVGGPGDYAAARVGFQFGKKIMSRASVRPDGIFKQKSTGRYIAYVQFDTISLRRKHHILFRNKKQSTKRQAQSILPSEMGEDPYIAGILVALAQEQRRRRVALVGDTEHSPGQMVHAIGVKQRVPGKLYIYTALIPDVFLDKLESPSEFCESPRVSIKYFLLDFTQPVQAANYLWLYWKEVGMIS
ncbi:hypothetical protein E4U43_008510 [Claviceps pusilla]|uniref:Uncharacterized protein n=1 Tax=Claviceps pusilla TaxID=123648 RepID=A0A9P7NBQ4_9HYPO|nr:hypothetical protein E4U43_008510 [Claviceps pusilla]